MADRVVWLIRVQDGNGWSDYPAIYGDTMTSEKAAKELAAKLAGEKPDHNREYDIPRTVSLYRCEQVSETIT